MGTPRLSGDRWLSDKLRIPSFQLHLSDTPSHPFVEMLDAERAFVSSKVPVTELLLVRWLVENGFTLVDTNLQFELHCEPREQSGVLAGTRLAQSSDEESVVALASECFEFSRFHLDPRFSRAIANHIKSEWVRSYFRGERGDAVIVSEDRDAITGFVLLLNSGTPLTTIDLIGVSPHHRRQGIAGRLTRSITSQFPTVEGIRVGTQIANIPSIRMYESLGFRFTSASYVFHYHHSDRQCAG